MAMSTPDNGTNRESAYEYAIEADPGQCTASFPTFGTLDEALIAATAPVMSKAGLASVRVLQRLRGAWTVAAEEASEVAGAIDIVARRLLAVAADDAEWEDWPEVGENDWQRVIDRACEIASDPEADEFEAAYSLLKSRAENHVEGSL